MEKKNERSCAFTPATDTDADSAVWASCSSQPTTKGHHYNLVHFRADFAVVTAVTQISDWLTCAPVGAQHIWFIIDWRTAAHYF